MSAPPPPELAERPSEPGVCAAPSAVTLYFPHASKGQSILARVQPNSWIVVDANHTAGGRPNSVLELLERYTQEESFRVLAVVITHFHLDHYSGVTGILDFCERFAQQRRVRLADVLGSVVLPQAYDAFYRYVGKKADKPGRSYLRKLLEKLGHLREHGVEIATLAPLSLAWTETNSEALQEAESWVVNLFPAPTETNREFFTQGGTQMRGLSEVERALQKNANRYVYILGVGWGRDSQHLHFLLTSDLPGDVFSELTAHLRDRVLPACMSNRFGAEARAIKALVRQRSRGEAVLHALRPVHGITVPHHGSGDKPARCADLEWWLDEERATSGRPVPAIVQGGSFSLKPETVKELFQAGLEVLATADPEHIRGRYTVCRELDERLPVPLRSMASSSFCVRPIPADTLPPHVAIHGGPGGIHRIDLKGVFRISPNPGASAEPPPAGAPPGATPWP